MARCCRRIDRDRCFLALELVHRADARAGQALLNLEGLRVVGRDYDDVVERGVVMFILAGLLAMDSLWRALLPAVLYFAIQLTEGETITPMLLARRFTLNPVLVILSLISG